MDLIVSGLALSFQWWPTAARFEESLTGKLDVSPAMVEHAGEVIYQAVSQALPEPGTKLVLIYDPGLIDLGHYLPVLEKEFGSISQLKPSGRSLFDDLKQAAELIRADPTRHVVICGLSPSGSAAIVVSADNGKNPSSIKLRFADDPRLLPALVDYVVLSDVVSDHQEKTVSLLRDLFQDRRDDYPIALGCCSSANALSSEILAFIHTILSIKNQIIPACSSDLLWLKDTFAASPLYPISEYRPWLARGSDYKRSALVLFQQVNQAVPVYILLEGTPPPENLPSVRILSGSDPFLIPLSGNDQVEILTKLAALEELSAGRASLRLISDIAYAQYYDKKDRFALAVLAANREQLSKELLHAKNGILQTFQEGGNWSSPNGSYFAAMPLGSDGLAFVYPGAFNAYPEMGRGLFFNFPGLQDAARKLIPDLGHSLAEDFLYIQSSRVGSDPEQIMADFYQHPNQLIESGISLSVLHTLILDQIFDVRPEAALGYSLGEVSMLWANRVWKNAPDHSEIWSKSTLFKDQLFGRMEAVRDYWSDQDLPEDFWRSFILKADSPQVAAACNREELVYLSIVNTPEEVVIVGEASACQRVIEQLGCRALPMPFNAVIHNPTMRSTLPAFAELYSVQTFPRSDIRFYSASDYQSLTLEQAHLAQAMAKMTCSPVDFPRLVNQVYQDGARIFIEVGAQKTCSRWIEHILRDKPHAVIPINKKYQPDLHGVLKVVALLLSHRVDLNLSPLFSAERVLQTIAKQIPIPLTSPAISPKVSPTPIEQHSPSPIPDQIQRSFFKNMDQVSAGLARSHQDYLETQQTLTKNLARVMQIQAGAPRSDGIPGEPQKALFTKGQIQAFTKGDHRVCFGDTFNGFGDRRIPRLPNGELQFIDRVIKISAQPEVVKEGSSLESEYDLLEQAWYKNGSTNSLPFVSLMEIALQPCGFLSALMGTIKGRESQDLYFRNLDGEGTLYAWPDSPSRTITNQVELLSSSSLENVIIQNYAFVLSQGGQPFYQGTSSFGYFPLPMLENQAGLEAGQSPRIWRESNPEAGTWRTNPTAASPPLVRSSARLPEIDRTWIALKGGKFASGYIYTRQSLQADDWFYGAHFYQDPVMPGSLGVETMARALIVSAPAWGLPASLKWKIKTGEKTNWKYRGQITPEIESFEIELHISSLRQTSEGWELQADGLLWKDSMPIYKVDNISLETY